MTVPLTAELAEVLRDHRRTVRGAAGWVFANGDGGLLGPCALRFPLQRALARAGITKRLTVHRLRRTFGSEKLRAADQVVALTGLRAPANDNTAAQPTPGQPRYSSAGQPRVIFLCGRGESNSHNIAITRT